MVSHSRAALGTSAIRFLNQPRHVIVVASNRGIPHVLVQDHCHLRIVAIQDVWRIDDEWWRVWISRLYFVVRLETGLLHTVYHDLVSDEWYEQRY